MGFNRRQNGGADFRVWAKTPAFYLHRVTVTRVSLPEDDWTADYSRTNAVSIRMEDESPQDGLRHLALEGDGRTTVTNLNGVICRQMKREGRPNGYLYFTINPSFKSAGLTNARCEVEYYSPVRATCRLQYDAVESDTHQPYKYASSAIIRAVPTNLWKTVTFRLLNGVFMNSQNGGADFRLEAIPPDIYVRRVTLLRENATAGLAR